MSKGFMLLALLLAPGLVVGQGFGNYGSKNLLHVQTASTLAPQRLESHGNMRFFTKIGDFIGGAKPANFKQTNFWDVQGNFLLSYGIAEHFDATALIRLYQDVHHARPAFPLEKEFNGPDDVFLSVKAGSFAVAQNSVELGLMGSFRFPISGLYNYPFEQYTAGGVELGIMGLLSYYKDKFIHERDFSLHLNFGYYYFNDAGKLLYEEPTVGQIFQSGNSATLQYGAGITYPTEKFNLNLELVGNAFTTQPDSFAFSRENVTYVSPSITFKPNWRYTFDVGMDIRVTSNKDETSPRANLGFGNLNLPNYPGWRMTLGFGVVIDGGQSRFDTISGKDDVREKVDFYQRLLNERDKTRSIEDELRRLKREREQAEKELEELRQLLEDEGK